MTEFNIISNHAGLKRRKAQRNWIGAKKSDSFLCRSLAVLRWYPKNCKARWLGRPNSRGEAWRQLVASVATPVALVLDQQKFMLLRQIWLNIMRRLASLDR